MAFPLLNNVIFVKVLPESITKFIVLKIYAKVHKLFVIR